MAHISHSEIPYPSRPYEKAVRVWLLVVCAFIAAMVLVGGLTRLTDSGLSITEWRLISGALPPMSVEAWNTAFAKYRQIPEYKLVNDGMNLAEFKSIFWWEWGHRFLGRTIGFVFFVPFVLFAVKKAFSRSLMQWLAIIFVLGGLQGALGWYMVQSGLVDRVDVSQYRLAAHLGLAILLFGCVFWTYLRIGTASNEKYGHNGHRRMAAFIVVAVFGQILLGALVAGLHAGRTYNTWPLMDGAWLPEGLFDQSPLILNFFENILTVQFDHRLGAYVICLCVLAHAICVLKAGASASIRVSLLLMGVVLLGQVGLGIWTLLQAAPLDLSVAHQMGALVLFACAIFHLHTLFGSVSDERVR